MPDLSWLPDPPKAGRADLSWLPDPPKPPEDYTDRAHQALKGSRFGGVYELGAGTQEGLRDVYQMARHPLDTLSAFGSSLKQGAEALPDVLRNLRLGEESPEARAVSDATVRGFGQGATQGATGVNVDEAKANPLRAAGRFTGGVVIPSLLLKGAGAGVKLARAAMPAIEAAPGLETALETATRKNAGGRLVPPPAAPDMIGQALDDVRQPTSPARSVSLPPEPTLPPGYTPRTTAPALKIAKPTKIAKAKTPDLRTAALSVDDLPDSWKSLAQSPTVPARDVPMWGETPPPVATDDIAAMRRAVGADKASASLGMTPDEVRVRSGDIKHQPLAKENAALDREYLRRIHDERGAVDPALLRDIGLGTAGVATGAAVANPDDRMLGGLVGGLAGLTAANPYRAARAIQPARMIGMLSGAALPKSILGNIGAVATSAAEQGSMAPIREALRLPTVLQDAAQGFRSGANPSGIQGIQKFNIPGRLMGALDAATSNTLQRGGETLAGAQRLLLTAPKPLGNSPFGQALASPIGKLAVPFQGVPFNQVKEGFHALNELLPGSGASKMRRALTYGSMGAGAVAGDETQNPYMLAMIGALAGPRGLPFALGAGLTAGPRAVERIASVPDVSLKDAYNPLAPIDNPAILRLLKQMGIID